MNIQKTFTPRAWADFLLLSAIWGASFMAFAIILREVPVLTVVAHRVVWGAIAFWVFALWRQISIPKGISIWAACFVMGLLNNIIPFTLIAWGQTQIESGLVSILNATTAFFGLCLAALFFPDERLTQRKITGTVLAFFGVVTVIGFTAIKEFSPTSLAQIAILGGAFSYGLAAVWARRMLRSLPPMSAALGMLTGSSVMSLPLALYFDGAPDFSLETSTWVGIVYISLIATTGAYMLYYRVLEQAGSANLMLVTLMIAPIAIALGAVFLNEALSPRSYLGFGLIALGMIVIDGRLFGHIARRRQQ